MAKAVANQAVDNYYKPDLKKTALARHSVISKGLRESPSLISRRGTCRLEDLAIDWTFY
ncbi:unnamed protein product, partial [Brassica napus]